MERLDLDIALESLDSAINELDVAEEGAIAKGIGVALLLTTAVPIGLGLLVGTMVEISANKAKKAFDKYVSKKDQEKILEKAKELALPKIKEARNKNFKKIYKRDMTTKDLDASFRFTSVTKTTIDIDVDIDRFKIEVIDGDDMPTDTSLYQEDIVIVYNYVDQKFVI